MYGVLSKGVSYFFFLWNSGADSNMQTLTVEMSSQIWEAVEMDLMGVSDGCKINGTVRIATNEPEISNDCWRSSVTAPASTELSVVSNRVQQNALEMSFREERGDT